MPRPYDLTRQSSSRAVEARGRSRKLSVQFEREFLIDFFDRFQVDCVFDVGANAGQYAEMIRGEVGFNGPIVSFEPVPRLAAALRDKAAADANWYVYELALDRETRETEFHVAAVDQFSSLKTPSHSETRRFVKMNSTVETVCLRTSTLGIEFPKIQAALGFRRPFLKVDTQGNDVEVVEGADDVLDSFVGLQSELAIRRLYENSKNFSEALEIYAGKGFTLSALIPNNGGHFPDLMEINCIMYNNNMI